MQAACPHPAPPTAGRALAVSRGNCDADHPRLSTDPSLYPFHDRRRVVLLAEPLGGRLHVSALRRVRESSSCGAAKLPLTIVTATAVADAARAAAAAASARIGGLPSDAATLARTATSAACSAISSGTCDERSRAATRSVAPLSRATSREAAITAETTSTSSSARTSSRSRRRSADAAVAAPSSPGLRVTADHHDQAGGDRRYNRRRASSIKRRSRGLELLKELVDPGRQ